MPVRLSHARALGRGGSSPVRGIRRDRPGPVGERLGAVGCCWEAIRRISATRTWKNRRRGARRGNALPRRHGAIQEVERELCVQLRTGNRRRLSQR